MFRLHSFGNGYQHSLNDKFEALNCQAQCVLGQQSGQHTGGSQEVAIMGRNTTNCAMATPYMDHQGIVDSFPIKLHLLLGAAEKQGNAHIASWQPHGKSFIVYNRVEFVQRVLPAFFRISKFESFQRQLNLYGFQRITAGRNKGGYHHESFIRDLPDLCFDIQRRKVKARLVTAVPKQWPTCTALINASLHRQAWSLPLAARCSCYQSQLGDHSQIQTLPASNECLLSTSAKPEHAYLRAAETSPAAGSCEGLLGGAFDSQSQTKNAASEFVSFCHMCQPIEEGFVTPSLLDSQLPNSRSQEQQLESMDDLDISFEAVLAALRVGIL